MFRHVTGPMLSCEQNWSSLFLHPSLSPSFLPLIGLKLEKRQIWGFPNVSGHKEMFSSVKGDGGKPSAWLTCQRHFRGSCLLHTPIQSRRCLQPPEFWSTFQRGPTIPWTLMLHSLLNLLPETLFLVWHLFSAGGDQVYWKPKGNISEEF